MKLRHLILFFIACAVLILAGLPGGSLLALCVWLQIYNLFAQKEFSKRSQRWAFFLFLISLPFVFFWGSIHSFLFVYLHEKQILFSMMAASVDICLCLIAAVYFSFTFDVAESAQFQLNISLKKAFAEIKMKKAAFFQISCLLFIFSLVPFFSADWKIVFSIMATQLFLRRRQLKPVFDSGL